MSIDVQSEVKEPPLTRVEIEYLLNKAGGNPAYINLTEMDLSNIDLSNLNLQRINLTRANPSNADLRGSDLTYAYLGGANLSRANVSHANLNYANLSHSNLASAVIIDTNLRGANLYSATLAGATLHNTDLSNVDLTNAELFNANMYNVDLTNVVLDKTNIYHATFSNITIDEQGWKYLKSNQVNVVEKVNVIMRLEPVISIRIMHEPLTPQILATTFTALTELTTKFWLIAKHRLPDLIEYNKTLNVRFADEAGIIITRASYNSPFSFDLKFDMSATSVADATMTVVNGLSQRKAIQEQLELANQAASQKIKEGDQKSELKQTREQLAIEREKVALLRETMEVQKLGIEYALEIADKLVDKLHPNADPETKGMLIRTLLPNILQLDNVKGLELALPMTKGNDNNPKQ